MDEVRDRVAADPALAHQPFDGKKKGAARIIGTGEDLDAGDVPAVLIPGDAIGEGAADIDAEAPPLL